MVQDTRTGQAVHTGWLSAAPQRFFIGSNSFRTHTCFEERSEGIVASERKARPIGGIQGDQIRVTRLQVGLIVDAEIHI
jgi:hypothetical protein